ncbi:hypothetical protein M011DRAFT_492708 [Sporormia fimetaria CBS 119925]|uniref:Zn(2)-C6 fungal-type domain-containing protein n=1 Tax=Sporormia fimetaria CBS 119925 TaxID=1340428 RepID=A0A6A6VG89_9PLEO|nr:hypothetical protein M011DRAFT_492708 [Sporormia fimetaria CBS 119925]
MASNSSYPDPPPAGAGPGLYGNQNGGTPPARTQQELSSEADRQLQENLAQFQHSNDMMHVAVSSAQQMNQMNALAGGHHHFQSPPRPTHSPQQMAQTVMNMEDHNIYSSEESNRKRSKVSRACDECRRKKIRCDAASEVGPESCSSCKRTGAQCRFSRQPMKRGPSKGYIKELADRLNNLESQIQNPHAPQPAFDYPPVADHGLPDPHALSRKRTHSMSETIHDPYGRPSWPSQEREFSTNAPSFRRPSFSDMALASNLISSSNEGTIKAYFASIHMTLPLLSHDGSSLARLTHAHLKLREAFFLALECAIRATSSTALPSTDASLHQLVQQCQGTLELAQLELIDSDHGRQFSNGLIYGQSLVLLVIALEQLGPGVSDTLAELLGRLAGRISALGINDAKVAATLRDQDPQGYEDSRRLFWVAFIIDRIHASARGTDTVLPTHYRPITRSDLNALGEVGYHLARAADTAGQINQMTRAGEAPDFDPSSPWAGPFVTGSSAQQLFLNGQVARFRESIDITDMLDTYPPYIACQFLCLLVARYFPHTASRHSLAITRKLLRSLTITPVSPLHHLFAHVVAVSLAELADRVETQVESQATIKEMDDAIANGQIVHRNFIGAGWDTAIRNILHQKKALSPPITATETTSPAAAPNMAGLQHLAAAAVEREGADGRPASSGGNGSTAPTTNQEAMRHDKHDLDAAIAAAHEAAAAQATAAAAQHQLNSTGEQQPAAGAVESL